MSDQRAAELKGWADGHGFEFSAAVPESLLDTGFYLFTLGQDHEVVAGSNLLTGAWQGMQARVFDVSFPELAGAAALGVSGYWIEHDTSTAAMVEVPADLPYVYVEKKGLLTRAADDLDRIDRLHHDHLEVTCGARDFDTHFEVKTTHREFAHELFDHPLMEAVLASGTGFVYEVYGERFIVHGPRMRAAELPALLDAAKRFRDNISRDVLDRHAAGAPGSG